MKVTVIPVVIGALVKSLNGFEDKRTSGDHPDDSITKIGQNRGCPRGVMVKVMDCRIVVCEFVLQSRYYVHFRATTLGKGINLLILPAMGQIALLLFSENSFGIK